MSLHVKKLFFVLTASTLLLSNGSIADEIATTTPPAATPLSAADFYQMPAYTNVQLSPDGNYIVALKNIGAETAIITINLQTGATFYPSKTDNQKFKFNWIKWANNDRILISIRYTSKMINSALNYYETRLVSLDAKKPSEMVNMVRPQEDNGAATFGAKSASQFQDNVIGSDPKDPDKIFLSVDRDIQNRPTVLKVNVNSGAPTLVKKADARISNWYLDAQGVVRAGMGYDDESRKVSVRVLDPKTDKWVTAWEYVNFEEPDISVLGFGKSPTDMYVLADHNGRQALFKADLSKEGYPKELILSDEQRDISGELIYSGEPKEVVGLYYNDGEDKSVFWNSDYKKFQAGLDKALPNASNYITNFSEDRRKYILQSYANGLPATIYYGNRDTKQLTVVATPYPKLTADVLVKKERLTYKARDGLELDGYLSRPRNSGDKPLETIILPHGGPMTEDGAGFDNFSAFFVNRGYAVFQPNFRGSSGRGHEFMMKAVGGMGLEMQDDLEDAVKFLVDKKIAAAGKLCIVGASYGGYAALMGAAKTPDLFQCSISFAGISDLKKLRAGSSYYQNKNAMREQLGNDMEQLKKTSPVRMVDRIKIPVLLIHGSKDAIVPVEQSRIMADELKDQKKSYEYIELEEGTHYLDNLQHRQQTFEAMEAFLKKYLPIAR